MVNSTNKTKRICNFLSELKFGIKVNCLQTARHLITPGGQAFKNFKEQILGSRFKLTVFVKLFLCKQFYEEIQS